MAFVILSDDSDGILSDDTDAILSDDTDVTLSNDTDVILSNDTDVIFVENCQNSASAKKQYVENISCNDSDSVVIIEDGVDINEKPNSDEKQCRSNTIFCNTNDSVVILKENGYKIEYPGINNKAHSTDDGLRKSPNDLTISEDKEYIDNQLCIFKEKQWTGDTASYPCMPVLIAEIFRFVPYLNEKFYHFHPINMPDLTIRKVEIIGRIRSIILKPKFYEFMVDDGTGVILVVCKKSQYSEQEKKRAHLTWKHFQFMLLAAKEKPWLQEQIPKCGSNVSFHKHRPPYKCDLKIPEYYRAILEHGWWMETENGLLGKRFEVYDYVTVIGYCSLDFELGQKPLKELTLDDLIQAKVFIQCLEIKIIGERDYNCKIQSTINSVLKERYGKLNK
ncbi:uncharacterized protein LOC105703189 isoform X2 [Orussus abietinus]|uniref:uncharacterized protein LOC105703189 isoform X2 n=1 Tax=Orussus abietinus TaxID=222816 RepID=UPI000626CB04|nr:uncharacterized protein LOC105703189 isoform X2 [Orussus abietinus]